MAEKIQCIVIGAGVVGLSIARELCLQGIETCVIEKEATFGTETSSRNSEVIHAGIYYPENSLKAQLCVQGKHMLYRYCKERNIPFSNTGKLIVANNEKQLTRLKSIKTRAERNGVTDLTLLSKAELKEKEANINAQYALFSPSTGILDSHQYMLSLIGDIESNGGFIVYNTEFISAEQDLLHWKLILKDSDYFSLNCHQLINSAGLYSEKISRNISSENKFLIPGLTYAKGNYFNYHGKHSFRHLIYPVPEKDGLGIHMTIDLSGQIRFGPDVEWVSSIDYQVDSERKAIFYHAIKNYWPDVQEERLTPDYSGIRPKLHLKENSEQDFIIQQAIDSKQTGLINLYGIESPGLTASLAIGKQIASMVGL